MSQGSSSGEMLTSILLPAEELVLLSEITSILPGVTIEIMPVDTEEDVEVAAAAYALSAELTDDNTVNGQEWEHQARFAMEHYGAVVQVTTSRAEGPNSVNAFFSTLARLKQSRK